MKALLTVILVTAGFSAVAQDMRSEVLCTDAKGVTLTIQAKQIEIKSADGSATELVPYRYDADNDRYLLTGPYDTLKVSWTRTRETEIIQMDPNGWPLRPSPTQMVLTMVGGSQRTFSSSCGWK